MALITLDGTELRRSDGRIHSWIRKGFYGPADYRGSNDIIPEAAGEEAQPWIAWRRTIELGQKVTGAGASEVAAQQDFLTLADSLRTLYESTQAAPKELRVYTPLYGITSGYRKLSVRWVNSIEGDPIGGFAQLVTIRFECVDSPPSWVAVP
jgi:hypothetical protein